MSRARRAAPLLALPLLLLSFAATAQDPGSGSHVTHGLSLFGSLKYPPDFARFDYVNPDAPKGGRIRLSQLGTYDSFNPFIVQGTAEPWSSFIYDSLLKGSYDEPSTSYGNLAESVEVADDYSWVIYTLRANAHFHDGVPITAEDIVFTLDLLRDKGAPIYASYYKNIVGAEVLDEHRVRFTFDQPGNRELPQITGELFALPKHYWEGKDENGKPRDFARSTIVPPLGSGPYKIGRFEPGRFVEYVRVDDYWGKDLPVNVGSYNFDTIRFDYYRDSDIALEAFFADDYDVRIENIARNWATAYDRPAVTDGRIKLDKIPYALPVTAQVYYLNLRRAKFSDRRVRLALSLAFNFEWINKNIFYGQYERVTSYWFNSELAATGLPSAGELELLEPYRDQLPPELFTEAYSPPVSDGTETNRNNLYRALQLLQEAGWKLSNGKLVDDEGKPFEIEFLIYSQSQERVIQPYIQDLEKLGITGTIRLVDTTQYTERVQNHDFDVFSYVIQHSLSPGNEQRDEWGSAAADQDGSRNFAGIKNPVVDALIDKIIFAPNREALVTATHALDRVLLWNYYTIPAWTLTYDRYAIWDRFDHVDALPKYHPGATSFSGIPELWWAKDAKK